MDSVYDAVRAHADELKAELQKLQNFLDLHDHFRNRFGLTPAAAPAEAASSEDSASRAEAPPADETAATHEIRLQEPLAGDDQAGEAQSYGGQAASGQASGSQASNGLVSEQGWSDSEAPPQAEASATADDGARVIQASEGVLALAGSEAEAGAPLGPEATLKSVADKLAATISASHPSVTGYTV